MGNSRRRKQPFVQRDRPRFSVSERQFRERAIGNRFGEAEPEIGFLHDGRGRYPGLGSFSGSVAATVRLADVQ